MNDSGQIPTIAPFNTSGSGEVEPDREPFYELYVANMLQKTVPFVLIVLGTVGNCLSLIVFSRPVFRTSTTGLYFRILAVMDTITLHANGWFLLLDNGFLMYFFTNSNISCKVGMFIIWLSRDIGAWILVLVSLERFIAVVVPHQAKSLCTEAKAKISVVVAIVVMIAIDGPPVLLAVQKHLIPDKDGRPAMQICNTRAGGAFTVHFMRVVWPWLDMIKYSLIPFTIMIVCNVSIVNCLFKATIKRRHHLGSGNGTELKMTAMTANLLLISFAFLILTTPVCVFVTYSVLTTHIYGISLAKLLLFRTVAILLSTMNGSVNFFLYCIGGSSFRRELRLLFCTKSGLAE